MEIFPRYTREENRNCKLTDKQICAIRIRHDNGESYPEIAEDYEITPQAIFYWCMSEEDRKERQRNNYKRTKPRKMKNLFNYKEYRQRKKELHPELTEYEKSFTVDIRKKTQPNYLASVKNTNKKMYIKNKDKLKKKHKQYQLAHLDKFRLYNHKQWLKKKQEKENINKNIKK